MPDEYRLLSRCVPAACTSVCSALVSALKFTSACQKIFAALLQVSLNVRGSHHPHHNNNDNNDNHAFSVILLLDLLHLLSREVRKLKVSLRGQERLWSDVTCVQVAQDSQCKNEFHGSRKVVET